MKIYEIIKVDSYKSEHCSFVSSRKKAINYIKAQGEITIITFPKKDNPFQLIWFYKNEETVEDWENLINSLKGTYHIFSTHENFYIKIHNVE